MTKVLRGFYIRTVTGNQKTDLTHAWSEAGTLPAEWDQTKQDPAVVEAQLFSSTQRNRQHGKRKILEGFSSASNVWCEVCGGADGLTNLILLWQAALGHSSLHPADIRRSWTLWFESLLLAGLKPFEHTYPFLRHIKFVSPSVVECSTIMRPGPATSL